MGRRQTALQTRARTLAPVLALALVAGCATTAGYEQILNSWIGSGESQLVAAWGPPDSFYVTPDGDRVLTYRRSRTVTGGGYPISYPVTQDTYGTVTGADGSLGTFSGTTTTYVTQTTPVYSQTFRCITHFTVRKKTGQIATWRWRGNDCVAVPQD